MISPYGQVQVTTQMLAPYQQQFNNSSNDTFLHEAQQRFDMPLRNSHVPVSAFGDLPMMIGRSGMVALPNKDIGATLVATYFEKVSPSLLFLHRPSVESWTMDVLSEDGYTLHKNELKSRNAAVFLIFASAQAYNAGPEPLDTRSASQIFSVLLLMLLSPTVCFTFTWRTSNYDPKLVHLS